MREGVVFRYIQRNPFEAGRGFIFALTNFQVRYDGISFHGLRKSDEEADKDLI